MIASLRRSTRIGWVLTRATAGALALSVVRRSAVPLAEGLTRAFEDLGPAFVKLGQFLSVRPDLIGPELSDVFGRLRDRAREIPAGEIREILRRELGAPAETLFRSFDDTPLGAASLSQVHRAELPDGRTVAVKVQRPGAALALERDVALLARIAALLGRAPFLSRHLDLEGFVGEIGRSAAQELDFRREGEIAERFARAFRDEPGLRIPRIHWGLTSRRILTMDCLEGFSISDPRARGTPGYEKLAEEGARFFFRQVLDLGLFHADLHPSNLFVTADGRIGYVDFGIWGELGVEERHAILGTLAGLLARDATLALRHLARLGIEIPPERRISFARDVSAELDRAMGPTLQDTSVARMGLGLLAAVRKHRVRVPHKYALLVKALLTVEGSARLLHGSFDMEAAARAYLLNRPASRIGIGTLLEAAYRAAVLAALAENEGFSKTEGKAQASR
jgi:ubiquinone biosynthesis protein